MTCVRLRSALQIAFNLLDTRDVTGLACGEQIVHVFRQITRPQTQQQDQRCGAERQQGAPDLAVAPPDQRHGYRAHRQRPPRRCPSTAEHTSELQSQLRITYLDSCLKKENKTTTNA